MGIALRLNEHNFHEVTVGGRRLLFHIPSSGLFEADHNTAAVISALRVGGELSVEALGTRLNGQLDGSLVDSVVGDLESLGIVDRGNNSVVTAFPPVKDIPLTTVVLNVNTGCNLSCTYCYKEDLATPAQGEKMGLDTAIASLEMLLEQSPDQERYNVVFFGESP